MWNGKRSPARLALDKVVIDWGAHKGVSTPEEIDNAIVQAAAGLVHHLVSGKKALNALADPNTLVVPLLGPTEAPVAHANHDGALLKTWSHCRLEPIAS